MTAAMFDVASSGFAHLIYIVVFVGIPLMIASVVIAIVFGLSAIKKKKRELERMQNEQHASMMPETEQSSPEQHNE